MDSPFFYIAMLVLGLAVGLISAALGVGGGILMVPAFLAFVPGMDPHTAKGTSLFAIVFIAAQNTWRMRRAGVKAPRRLTAILVAGSILGGYGGGWASTFLPGEVILWLFITLLTLLGIRTFMLDAKAVSDDEVRSRNGVAFAIALVNGVVSAMTGVGGGIVMVPMSLLARIVTNERVVALSNSVMIFTCLAGSAAHVFAPQIAQIPWTYGQINVAVAALVFAGTWMGAPLGQIINEKLTLARRRVVMGALLLVIAVQLVFRALG
ncbi:MAG: sulfite exporter TauE/SafE family protein [Candidatus Hydrogenedentes bacterium]|nr:sulfite exporter TauE/SafE family protein [Candidatus Hydrogenedentota bacterium]